MKEYCKYDLIGQMVKFDAKGYLKDYDFNEKVLRSLKDQLAELTEIPGQSDEPKVKTTRTNNGLENMTLRGIHLKAQIAEYEAYFKTCSKALSALETEERDILESMYVKRISAPVWVLCDKYHISESEVYRRKDKALDKFSQLMVGSLPGNLYGMGNEK